MDDMYCILLHFKVKRGRVEEFQEYWAALTKYIYENFGSLGSRLHCIGANKFIAYAQWPNKSAYKQHQAWTKSGLLLRSKLRDTLVGEKVTVLEKLNVVCDMLEKEPKT